MGYDPVNHPSHYTQYKREVIDLTEKLSFCVGNAYEYIFRAPYKGRESEDLCKAQWYVARSLKYHEQVSPKSKEVAKSFDNVLVNMLLECYSIRTYGCVYAHGMVQLLATFRQAVTEASVREELCAEH